MNRELGDSAQGPTEAHYLDAGIVPEGEPVLGESHDSTHGAGLENSEEC